MKIQNPRVRSIVNRLKLQRDYFQEYRNNIRQLNTHFVDKFSKLSIQNNVFKLQYNCVPIFPSNIFEENSSIKGQVSVDSTQTKRQNSHEIFRKNRFTKLLKQRKYKSKSSFQKYAQLEMKQMVMSSRFQESSNKQTKPPLRHKTSFDTVQLKNENLKKHSRCLSENRKRRPRQFLYNTIVAHQKTYIKPKSFRVLSLRENQKKSKQKNIQQSRPKTFQFPTQNFKIAPWRTINSYNLWQQDFNYNFQIDF